jgi:hypothetical protein
VSYQEKKLPEFAASKSHDFFLVKKSHDFFLDNIWITIYKPISLLSHDHPIGMEPWHHELRVPLKPRKFQCSPPCLWLLWWRTSNRQSWWSFDGSKWWLSLTTKRITIWDNHGITMRPVILNRNPTTSFLTATTLIYAIGAGITDRFIDSDPDIIQK